MTTLTQWQGATGIGGFFERTFAPKGLQRIQAQVLATSSANSSNRSCITEMASYLHRYGAFFHGPVMIRPNSVSAGGFPLSQ